MPANTPKTERGGGRSSNPKRSIGHKKQDRKVIQYTCINQGRGLPLLALNSTYVTLPCVAPLTVTPDPCYWWTETALFLLLFLSVSAFNSILCIITSTVLFTFLLLLFCGGWILVFFIRTGCNLGIFCSICVILTLKFCHLQQLIYFLRNFLETAAHGNPLHWRILQAKCSSDDAGTHLDDLCKLNKTILPSNTKKNLFMLCLCTTSPLCITKLD